MNEDLLRELAELREEVKGLNAKLDNISERVLESARNDIFEKDKKRDMLNLYILAPCLEKA